MHDFKLYKSIYCKQTAQIAVLNQINFIYMPHLKTTEVDQSAEQYFTLKLKQKVIDKMKQIKFYKNKMYWEAEPLKASETVKKDLKLSAVFNRDRVQRHFLFSSFLLQV